ncbi:hypothetical protein [Plantactinospora sp. GCM10030261]|uniref:hypothetical protein n=1 Tax=Plantactinospora sp. GCM10030261 TaxID=3273420 RepID=UPI00361B0CF6
MDLSSLASVWSLRVVGLSIGLVPYAAILRYVGWGPIGNDSVGEWAFILGFLGFWPALLTVPLALVLLRTGLREVAVGLLGAVVAAVLLWGLAPWAYAYGIAPPGIDHIPPRV